MMAAHFKGRVRHYFTLNEPQCTVSLGYAQGIHAPGRQASFQKQFACWVNRLLAHGFAQRAIQAADPDAVVGIASTGRICYPESETDIGAAREAMFAVSDGDWMFTHQMLLDPICLGRFPACPGTALEKLMSRVTPEEMDIIHTVPRMLGYNIYNGSEIRSEDGRPVYTQRYPGFPRTALKWPITPEALSWGPRFLWERYGIPGYITENGLVRNDHIFLDGQVHDPERIDFLHRNLLALQKAIDTGADIRGYFHWSLTDNFEWGNGYGERFGLIYIDYPTGNRIPKDSFYWYGELIQRELD